MELLAQDSSGGSAAGGAIFFIVYFAFIVVVIAGMWKTFAKAGQPGWTSIIPILNIYVEVKISGKEWWWFLLFFVPCINILAVIMVSVGIAERFGKTAAYGLGLAFLPFIFFPMLGFGDAEFQGTPEPIF